MSASFEDLHPKAWKLVEKSIKKALGEAEERPEFGVGSTVKVDSWLQAIPFEGAVNKSKPVVGAGTAWETISTPRMLSLVVRGYEFSLSSVAVGELENSNPSQRESELAGWAEAVLASEGHLLLKALSEGAENHVNVPHGDVLAADLIAAARRHMGLGASNAALNLIVRTDSVPKDDETLKPLRRSLRGGSIIKLPSHPSDELIGSVVDPDKAKLKRYVAVDPALAPPVGVDGVDLRIDSRWCLSVGEWTANGYKSPAVVGLEWTTRRTSKRRARAPS